jgi:hypothetical protein
MRNFYHIVIGFTIAYLFFIVFGINTTNFPLSLEYWNNFLTPLLGGIIAMIPAFFWERWQEKKFNATFDYNDIWRTGLGGLFGGITAMFFFNLILIIALPIISVYLVTKHYKK